MTGHLFTWELARPNKPFLHIRPIDKSTLSDRRIDGHVAGTAVLHVGFLGTRHTALVSADDTRMAFSHLATRGLGAVARTVKTTRILGRYPPTPSANEPARRVSSVLALSPLPLGNVEQPTDTMGLTALLTPYLLVIVSTTPVAHTQFKVSRPKELAPHSALSGSLAWFPAVKLKSSPNNSEQGISMTKLVYCWSNFLTVLDVDVSEVTEKNKLPELHFQPRSRWRSQEAIASVQWLSRSILAVLTISQRLEILEDPALRVTDSFDLLHKHIYHQDLFSKQLQPVVEQLDEGDVSMHGVVADGFHMSFRAYKGRLFLLGFNDVAIGTLSNWADRLLALMEEGDYIAGLRLATSYYNGDADKLTVGLPTDDDTRHRMVHEKLLEMVSGSIKYTFSRLRNATSKANQSQLAELASTVFVACMSMDEKDFLFEDVYEAYQEQSCEGVFFATLEPYVMSEEVLSVPPGVLKNLITYCASHGQAATLEEMICRLETQTMDLDQVTSLCKQFDLYEALVYVWNQALADYITPLLDFMSLIKMIGYDEQVDEAIREKYLPSAMKTFAYLAFALTGRIYPRGTSLDDNAADRAKSDIYGFILSGTPFEWPKGSRQFFSSQSDKSQEPSFPYLRMLLNFDSGSFMSMLNEAFEDSFLNGDHTATATGSVDDVQPSALKPTRQYIINILLGVMTPDDFPVEDVIYFYMFLARNLPKFSQYTNLPGTTLRRVLVGLCQYPSKDFAEDCQLSVEYLLSIYHPPDLEKLTQLFEQAGFYRVLKSVYHNSKEYRKLLETYFKDANDRDAVLDCIRDCLRPGCGLTAKQTHDVQAVIVNHARDLAALDAVHTAQIVQMYAPSLIKDIVNALVEDSQARYIFLRAILEPETERRQTSSAQSEKAIAEFIEPYVQLMCKYNPSHVADYVGLLQSGDLRLDNVLPAMETHGVVDAAVVLMARDGMVRNAMDRLVKYLGTVQSALTGLLDAASESPDVSNTEETAEDLLDAIQKYCKVGLWLCQGQTRAWQNSNHNASTRTKRNEVGEEALEMHELLWLDLLDIMVSLTKNVSTAASSLQAQKPTDSPLDTTKLTNTLRNSVQETFSTLLATMSSTTPASKPTPARSSPPNTTITTNPTPSNPTFLPILHAFLTRASRSSPSLSDLRAVLADIFSAYAFESTLLALSSTFLERDAFSQVQHAHELRQRGWRPRGQLCEGCKGRVWGPGAGGAVWDAWEKREREREEERRRGWVERGGGEAARRLERGKGRADGGVKNRGGVGDEDDEDDQGGHERAEGRDRGGGDEGGVRSSRSAKGEDRGPLVVFACRHLWHRLCLQRAQSVAAVAAQQQAVESSSGGGGRKMQGREFACPMGH